MNNHLVKNLLVITIISFFLFLVWEYWQCNIFYTMRGTSPSMLVATLGDVLMMVVLYLILSWVNMNVNWFLHRWSVKEYVIMIFYSLTLSFYIEAAAIKMKRWSYTDSMPLLLNTDIGILPIVQLLIIFPLSFLISSLIVNNLRKNFSKK